VIGSSRTALAVLLLAAACDGAPRAEAREGAPDHRSGGAASPVTARGVELRLPQPGGDVVISGGDLALGEDQSAVLAGGVRVRSEGSMRFEAAAARAALSGGGRVAVLEGGVRAVLEIEGDAGAANE